MPVAPEQLVGTQAGRYRLERILGEGGMGTVYLGVDAERGSRVAIKVLSKQTADSMQRFRAEARAVSLISHFNIVNLIDVAELPDGRPYMVMELVEGQSLRDLAASASVEHVARIGVEVLAALEAAHAIGIVHRDLKPDNIMVTKAGHAKVLDFGVAKLAPGVGGGFTPRTKDGLTMGTPAYMAPEQVTGSAVDARTDIYTMGVVLFEVLAGQRPFAGNDVEVMRAHRDQPPPRPRALAPAIPQPVEDVILRALAKDPARRFASAKEMAAALADAVAGRAPAAAVSGEDTPTVRGRPLPPSGAAPSGAAPSRIPALIAIAAIAIAATVVFLIARARRNHRPRVTPPVVETDPAHDEAPVPDVERDAVAPDATPAPSEVPVPPDAALAAADAALAAADAATALAADAGATEPRSTPKATALPAPISRARDFTAEAFDPLAYLARATEIARELSSDAQLVELQARPVNAAGTVDLTRAQATVEYRFMSLIGMSGEPITGGRPCLVVVSISPAGARARVAVDRHCAMKPVPAPRCSVKDLRRQVENVYSADGIRQVDINLAYRGRWVVFLNLNTVLNGADVHRIEIPDCP